MTPPSYTPAPPADFVLPFDLPQLGVRGRLVRLDAVSSRALEAHLLPEPAARVAAETLVLAAMLGSALKLDGRLTVQTKSDGALDLAASDYYGADGAQCAGLRGYARIDEARLTALGEGARVFAKLVGAGVLAITIEPKLGGQTYQGVVALSPEGIAASAETYFAQSEQLPTALKIAAGPVYIAGRKQALWRAGGLMLQSTPEGRGSEDDWRRLSLFLATLADFELLDTALAAEALLWRLFHEDEVRVQPAERLEFRCSCETGRIASVLRSYSSGAREGLADADGIIRVRCEFCGAVHEVAPGDLQPAG
jgi:molecular chaperone Hsp33